MEKFTSMGELLDMPRKKKLVLTLSAALITLLTLPWVVFGIRSLVLDVHMQSDLSAAYRDPQLTQPVILNGTPTVTLEETCGYATIQWMTRFLSTEVTEQDLLRQYPGVITTAFPKNFGPELAKQLGASYKVNTITHATDLEILQALHASLKRGLPVPISFAAIDATRRPNYSLHYSVVTGMDLKTDKIYVSNVYGYEEIYSVSDFLDALKFKNYVNMPAFIWLGTFFGVFHKNMIFLVEAV